MPGFLAGPARWLCLTFDHDPMSCLQSAHSQSLVSRCHLRKWGFGPDSRVFVKISAFHQQMLTGPGYMDQRPASKKKQARLFLLFRRLLKVLHIAAATSGRLSIVSNCFYRQDLPPERRTDWQVRCKWNHATFDTEQWRVITLKEPCSAADSALQFSILQQNLKYHHAQSLKSKSRILEV